jgi:hypothetical protein
VTAPTTAVHSDLQSERVEYEDLQSGFLRIANPYIPFRRMANPAVQGQGAPYPYTGTAAVHFETRNSLFIFYNS